MVEVEVDIAYLEEADELDGVMLIDENGEMPPRIFVPIKEPMLLK